MKTLPPIPSGPMPQTDTRDQQRRKQLGLSAHESQPSTAVAIYAAFAIGIIAGFAICLVALT